MSDPTPDVRVVLCTAPREAAPDLARALVDRRLVACVNLLPEVRSFYRWEGAVQDDPEALLVMKTTAEGVDALLRELPALHPYDVPEILALPVAAAHAAYAAWVGEETG